MIISSLLIGTIWWWDFKLIECKERFVYWTQLHFCNFVELLTLKKLTNWSTWHKSRWNYVYHCLVHKLIFNLPYSHNGWKCIASKICWSLGHSLQSNSFWICGIWIIQPMIIQLHSYQNYCHPIFSWYTKVVSSW